MRKKHYKPYTLVEMLVVMAIAAILIAIAVPAFSHIIAGNKLVQAGSQLKGLLEQAQSIAATRERTVAVLLPNQRTSAWNGSYSDMVYRTGRLAYVDRNSDGTYQFNSWVEDSPWVYFPDGVMLVKVDPTTATVSLPDGATGLSGAISTTNTAMNDLTEVKGIKDVVIDSSATISSSNCGVVFTRYGAVAGSGLRLYLADAKDAGTNVVYPKRDGSNNPLDFIVLEVNQFTGRARYL